MAIQKRSAYLPDPDLPPHGQAVSLALAIMRACKVTSWDQLEQVIPSDIVLYPGQLQLLRDHAAELLFIRSSGEPDVVTVSIALCPVCGLWQLVDKQPPKRCQLTIGCTGEPAKIAAAAKASIPSQEDSHA